MYIFGYIFNYYCICFLVCSIKGGTGVRGSPGVPGYGGSRVRKF